MDIVPEFGVLMSECDRLCKGSDYSKLSVCHVEPICARHRYGLLGFHEKLHESASKEPEKRGKEANPSERTCHCAWTLGLNVPSNKQGAEEGAPKNDWLVHYF